MTGWMVVEREDVVDDAGAFRTLIALARDTQAPAPGEGGGATAEEFVRAFLAPPAAAPSRRLAARLLAYAGQRPLAPAELEPLPFLRGLAHSLRRVLDVRIEVLVRARHDCPACRADPAALEEALLELVANARDAMPAGGVLALGARACDLPDARPGVEISVVDSGAGMSDEAMKRAGQPFFTTKVHLPLAGMGLAAANGFARGSGGVLALHGPPSGGLTAALRLPRARSTD